MKESKELLRLRIERLETTISELVQACDSWQERYDRDCPVPKLDDDGYRRELNVLYDAALESGELDLARLFLEKRQAFDK